MIRQNINADTGTLLICRKPEVLKIAPTNFAKFLKLIMVTGGITSGSSSVLPCWIS